MDNLNQIKAEGRGQKAEGKREPLDSFKAKDEISAEEKQLKPLTPPATLNEPASYSLPSRNCLLPPSTMNQLIPISPFPNSTMNQLIATTQKPSSNNTSINPIGILKPFMSAEGIGMIVFMIVLVWFSNSSSGKGKITTGKTSSTGELLAATSLALQQIKERKHNKVCFYCGSPRYWWKGNHLGGKIRRALSVAQTMVGNSPTVWIPHAERSTLVLGAPGGGKTFGTIDRMAESCLQQGFPMLVYARKEDEMQYLAPLAARYGYNVRIFVRLVA